MIDWAPYMNSVKTSVGEYAGLAPETFQAFRALSNVPPKHLNPKFHELIALCVAITTRCDGCIGSHVQAALKHGASKEEIAEALSVAISLNAGAAMVHTAKVFEAVSAFESK